MNPSREKTPFTETDVVGRPRSIEFHSLGPRIKVEEQKKTFGPLLCFLFSKVAHMNLDVDFFALILFMVPLVS